MKRIHKISSPYSLKSVADQISKALREYSPLKLKWQSSGSTMTATFPLYFKVYHNEPRTCVWTLSEGSIPDTYSLVMTSRIYPDHAGSDAYDSEEFLNIPADEIIQKVLLETRYCNTVAEAETDSLPEDDVSVKPEPQPAQESPAPSTKWIRPSQMDDSNHAYQVTYNDGDDITTVWVDASSPSEAESLVRQEHWDVKRILNVRKV